MEEQLQQLLSGYYNLQNAFVALENQNKYLSLQNNMIINLLRAGGLSDNKINEFYDRDVKAPFEEYINTVKNKMTNQINKIADQMKNPSPNETKKLKEDYSDEYSNVILASERFKNAKKEN